MSKLLPSATMLIRALDELGDALRLQLRNVHALAVLVEDRPGLGLRHARLVREPRRAGLHLDRLDDGGDDDSLEEFFRFKKRLAGDRSARPVVDDTLYFLCELGPPPYAMTDARQDELSDRWEEALKIRQWVQETWSELDSK